MNFTQQSWFQEPGFQKILELLNGDGGETRVVGGAVRNTLLGLPVSDIDLATTLLPQEVIARADAAGIRSVPTGIAHGTVTLVIDGHTFEVTTLRADTETDGRHAVVAFGTDWKTDAERRDFTMNALYVTATGEIVDLVDGMTDLESRTIRFIGDANRRIAEDHLRILRFFRFFAFYGSGRPDAEGLRASAAARSALGKLSAERIWSELRKLLSAQDPGRALLWMRQAGVLTEVLPETEKWGIDAIPALIATEQALHWKPNSLLRLAAIVPPDAQRLKRMAQRLKMSNLDSLCLHYFATVPAIKDDISSSAFQRLLYDTPREGVMMRLKLDLAKARFGANGSLDHMALSARLSTLLEKAQSWERPVFPVSGADIVAAGIPAGPRVGEILRQMEKSWIDQNFSTGREALLLSLPAFIAQH